MFIIKKTPDTNGAYSNQLWDGAYAPDGYYAIPESLESLWNQYAPFVTLTIENDTITGISDNPSARSAQAAIIDHTAEIAELKRQIEVTDYKIIKCYEYSLVALDLPYDIAALHAERQALRDQINQLEGG